MHKDRLLQIIGRSTGIDHKMLIDCQQSRYERLQAADATQLMLSLILQELSGGACPHCGVPWQKIVVKNALADFEYFDPDCECYPRCKRCGMSLHGIVLPNRHTPGAMCPRCGYAGQDRWIQLCHVCGMRSEQSDVYQDRFVCDDCKRGGRRKRKESYEV